MNFPPRCSILLWSFFLLILFLKSTAQDSGKKMKSGPVGPTREELQAFKTRPFHAALTSKKAVYMLGEYMDLTLKIRNVRMSRFKVVVPEISYLAVRFEIAYGKQKPFIHGRFLNNDAAPSRAKFDRLAKGRSEKARFKIPAVLPGSVRVTALYPNAAGQVFRSNTLVLEVVGKAPLTVAVKMRKKGKILLEFFPEQAPNSVTHFIHRVKQTFYDDLRFFRVEPGFVAQTGCPQSTGSGGPGYTIKGEFGGKKKHVRGALGMARNDGRNDSNGSQFYFCLSTEKCAGLNGKYTIFGQVMKGMDVVDRIKVGDRMESVEIVTPGKKKKGKK